jgi:peptidylprolyl isomerase
MSSTFKIVLSILGISVLIFILINLASLNLSPNSSNSSSSSTSSSSSISSSASTSSSAQLKTTILKEGTGDRVVKNGDTVSINYLGTLENGTKFDSSYDRGQPFSTQIGVGQVIKGWDLGVVGMKVGEKKKLVIPPSLGYGAQAVSTIPANSTLIFEVELMGIK